MEAEVSLAAHDPAEEGPASGLLLLRRRREQLRGEAHSSVLADAAEVLLHRL